VAADAVSELRNLADLLSAGGPPAGVIERAASGAAAFTEVDVDDPPEIVELEVDDSVELTLPQLTAAFGEPSFVPRMPHRPAQVAFYVEKPGAPAGVAIFASLDEDDEQRVRSITLRRDEL
jgi:hypothetical protein